MRFLFSAIFFLLPIGAISAPPVVIFNELAWMGRSQPCSSNDEWIELYNNIDSDIDLDGWRIVSDDNTPNIVLNGIIPGQGFYLLERTDDQTIPEIIASQIYVGALENSGENLKLIDKNLVLIDEIKIHGNWPAGDNSSKQTMERTGLGTWVTSQKIHGTPGQENSVGVIKSFLPEPTSTISIEYPKENKENSFSGNQGKIPASASVLQNNFKETENNSPWFSRITLTAMAIAAISGIAILMLKRLMV